MPNALPLRGAMLRCLSWDPANRPQACWVVEQIRQESGCPSGSILGGGGGSGCGSGAVSSGSGGEFPRGEGGRVNSKETLVTDSRQQAQVRDRGGGGGRGSGSDPSALKLPVEAAATPAPQAQATGGGQLRARATATPAARISTGAGGVHRTAIVLQARLDYGTGRRLKRLCAVDGCNTDQLNPWWPHCYKHSIRDVPVQLQLAQALQECGVLAFLMPCDLVAHVRAMGSRNGFLTEAVIAFLKDPIAIQAFGGCAPTGKQSWTGDGLEKALHATSRA
jgi:hypothetical protein